MTASPTTPAVDPGPRRPFVSVIIPVYDDAERLRRCLEALEGQRYPGDRYEVVVVDNGSPAPPVVAAHPHARLISEPARGSYQARNAGILASRGEVLAFTDSDCVPGVDWLAHGVQALAADPQLGLVAGRVALVARRDPRRPTLAESYNIATGFDQRAYVEQQHFGATANMFTWRRVVERVGLMDGELLSGGDNEWGGRVHRAGYRQWYCEEAAVEHPARATVGELCRKHLRVLWGQHCLADRNASGVAPAGWWGTLHGLFIRPVTRLRGRPGVRGMRGLALKVLAVVIGAYRGAVLLWLSLGGQPGDLKRRWR